MPGNIDIELAILREVRRILAESTSLTQVKELRDKVEAVRQYFRNAHLGLELLNQAAEAKLRAERRAGEMLGEMEKQGPGEYQRLHAATVAPSLADLGIEKTQSHRWQRIAGLPELAFEDYLRQTKAAGREITAAGLLRSDRHPPKTAVVSRSDSRARTFKGLRSRNASDLLSESLNHSEMLVSLLGPACQENSFPLGCPERRLVVRLLRELCEFLRELNG